LPPDKPFRSRINTGGGVMEDEDRGLVERSRNGDTLALSPLSEMAAFADDGLIPSSNAMMNRAPARSAQKPRFLLPGARFSIAMFSATVALKRNVSWKMSDRTPSLPAKFSDVAAINHTRPLDAS